MTPISVCYVCNSSKTGIRERKGEFIINECRNCGLLWVTTGNGFTKVQDYELHNFYDQNYYSSTSIIGYKNYLQNEIVYRRNANSILDIVSAYRDLKDARVIDIGCAFGFLLDEARRRGCDVYGVEVSQHAFEFATRTLGLRVLRDISSPSLSEGHFDVAFLIGTIEHLPDPRTIMEDARKFLRPGGLFVVTTLDTKGLIPLYSIKPPEHLYYFNHTNLEILLKEVGYRLLSRKTYFASFLLYDLLHRLAEFFGISALASVSRWFEMKYPKLSIRIPTNEMIIVAQKI